MNFANGPLRSPHVSGKLDWDKNLAAENENSSIYEQLPLNFMFEFPCIIS